MDDKITIKILTSFLKKYPLTVKEIEAVKEAIGILSWSKLMEGYVDRNKKARDKRLKDDDEPTALFE